jgi:predicted ATPase/class 3 adenylate cyclase
MTEYPSGTVTFLFTDIEGSTKLAQAYPDLWEMLRERHHAILRSAIYGHHGYVFQIIGDAFCAAFHTVKDGLNAALDAQRKLQAEAWDKTPVKVRMGLHTGAAELEEAGYRGYLTMARVQRVMSTAYGGQILLSNASAELIRGELPDGITLRDMQENRLKGLLNPEHLWQVVVADLPQDFPPLATLNNIPNNLPIQLTSFVGREKEIAEIKEQLSTTRLLTLTGSGGAGKTRLSLQVAAEVLDRFKNGVWFIELASLSDATLVPFTIASTLSLREEPDRLLSMTLIDWLRSKDLLLIFDNCEHLIEACAKFADEVLHTSPAVRILATSREPLSISGEWIYRVPSLQTPNPEENIEFEQFEQYAAVRLFIDRATQSFSTFQVTNANAPAIAQICYRLDGIPLAIELAAARVKSLPVEKIAERLDDRFRLLTSGSRTALPRQQTLRSMIDWSHGLLSELEQILFRRLSVFAGGWTLEAAEEVCSGDDLELAYILDLSTRLVDKSLVVMDEATDGSRFHMLETIRQYAMENLASRREADMARRRHAGYFSNLAKDAEQQHWTAGQVQWTDRLAQERDNLREALQWSAVGDREGTFLRLAGNLWRFWGTRGPLAEGRAWLDQASEVCEANADTLGHDVILEVLGGLGEIARYQGDYEYAIILKQKLLNMCRQWGDERPAAATLNDLAVMYADRGQCKHSLTLAEESLALRQKLGRPLGIAHALSALFFARMCLDEPQAAREAIQEAMQIYRDEQFQEGVAMSLISLIMIAIRQELYGDAERIWNEVLPLIQQLADQDITVSSIYGMGILAASQRKTQQAARLLGIAEQMAIQYGLHLEIPARKWVEDTIQAAKTSISEAEWAREYQAGQLFAKVDGLTPDQAIAFSWGRSDE